MGKNIGVDDDKKIFGLKKETQIFLLRKIVSYFLLIFNSLCIFFGFFILVGVNFSQISNLIGAIIFTCFFGNVMLNNLAIVKKFYHNIIRHAEFLEIIIIYEIITLMSAFFLGFGNFEQSMSYWDSEPIGSMGLVLRIPGFFVPFIFELYIVRKSFFPRQKEIENVDRKQFIREGPLSRYIEKKRIRKILNIIIKVCTILLLFAGLFFARVLFWVAPSSMSMSDSKEIIYGIFGIVVAPFAIFYAMAAFVNGFLVFKLNFRYKMRSKYNKNFSRVLYTTGILSIIISIMFASTLFTFPITQKNNADEWESVFGDEWAEAQQREGFEESSRYFLDETCKLSQYFLPEFEDNCRIIKDIVYYNDTTGEDNNVVFRYDVYMPKNYHSDMPGRNSTIIRIHGGAWMFGDKGFSNMLQFSKYLASQGYVVFDIQYGLYNVSLNPKISEIFQNMPQPEDRIGNFSLNDIIRFIGYFTNHLAVNAVNYSANLDSVFISGGSAGGNIACAATLAMMKPEYQHYFNNTLSIKGLIPYYPANDICRMEGLDHEEDFVDPKRMVNVNSPPCLIFQGTQDGLVYPGKADDFKNAYINAGNDNCAVMYAILAAHAYDVYYSGFYNQILIYYTERFLYIYR